MGARQEGVRVSAPFMNGAEIHALVGDNWPAILVQLGVPENALRNKHGPCPACGGKDKFRFDHAVRGKGSFWCNTVEAGDGFKLLQHVHGWTFTEARKRVMEAAGLGAITPARRAAVALQVAAIKVAPNNKEMPPDRVHRLRGDRCAVENCPDAVDYLVGRMLWPLPPGCTLWAHPAVIYSERMPDDVWKVVGRYPALVADVVDIGGELVASHVTYLHDGKKLAGHEPRKLWGKPKGWTGCAVRLMPAGAVLGIAEGIETALSAAVLHGVPVWAATNAGLLGKFEPPPGVRTLRVYADRDEAGRTETLKLVKRLQGRVRVENHIPPAPFKDWNDVLVARSDNHTAAKEHFDD
jgi:putative DNA primase/helicase